MNRGNADEQDEIKDSYNNTIFQENRAARYASCGECEEKGPQKLPIKNLVSRAARSFIREEFKIK